MKRLPKFLVLALGFALLLSACGGGGATINVTITDFAYTPNTFTVPAGAKVTLNATNKGAVEHEFAIMKLGTSVTPPFGDKDEANIFWELDEIGAGTTKSATFTAPTEPGEYEIICGLPAHIEKGMVGHLTVK
jgi:plastocyanin